MKTLDIGAWMEIRRYNEITGNEDEFEVDVTGLYYPEDDDLELTGCTDYDGREVDLTDQEEARAIEKLWAAVCDLDEEYEEEITRYDIARDGRMFKEDYE